MKQSPRLSLLGHRVSSPSSWLAQRPKIADRYRGWGFKVFPAQGARNRMGRRAWTGRPAALQKFGATK
jgi:hypothetical protein